MKRKTLDISGMGGSYEQGCQRMLKIGLEWIKDKPLSVWEGTFRFKNVYGVLRTGEGLKELEKIWLEDPFLKQGGITGAMHQAVMSHLFHIHQHGYEAWLKTGEKQNRIIEIEE